MRPEDRKLFAPCSYAHTEAMELVLKGGEMTPRDLEEMFQVFAEGCGIVGVDPTLDGFVEWIVGGAEVTW